MGQNTFDCKSNTNPTEDILNRQLQIYKWRADPKFNSCVARVTFTNACTLKQQQQFAEFLKTQEENSYLEIYKFRQRQRERSDLDRQQVIIFEIYRCNLKEVTASLSLQEIIYTLQSLLTGFQELRKTVGKIIVHAQCCFITKEGQVRAWINPNPKINQVYTAYNRQTLPEGRPTVIIKQILHMIQGMSEKSQKTQHLFQFLKGSLNKLNPKNNHFAQFRKTINEYCFHHNIIPSRNIQLQDRSSSKQIKNSWIRQMRKTQPCNQTKDTNICLSIIQSETKHTQLSSLQNNRNSFLIKKQDQRTQYSSVAQYKSNKIDVDRTLLPSATPITQKPQKSSNISCIHWGKAVNNKVVRISNDQTSYRPLSSIKNIYQAAQKASKINSVENQNGSIANSSKCSSQSQNHLALQNSTINITLMPQKNSPSNRSKYCSAQQKEQEKKKIMLGSTIPPHTRASIANDVAKSDLQKQITADKSYTNKAQLPSWITSKTITKLISQNQLQLVHSSGDSSDCYNGSVYSGILLQMGRDAQLNSSSHSKTTRLCKQV